MTAKEYFLKNTTILIDTREKENGECLRTFKQNGLQIANFGFKTGDYSFKTGCFDYRFRWVGERKGSLGEIYNNVMAGNADKESAMRNNLEEEFKRKQDSRIEEFVVFLQGAKNLQEVKKYKDINATKHGEDAGEHIYSTLMSWAAANRYDFKICCCETQQEIAEEMINYMYYFWRNDMKNKYGDNFLKIVRHVDNICIL